MATREERYHAEYDENTKHYPNIFDLFSEFPIK